MDASKFYIDMCEKAEEIQPHKIDDGDMYYWSVDKRCHLAYTEHYPEYNVKHPEQWDYLHGKKVIWLPRQDQLQEMIDKSEIDFDGVCYDEGEFKVFAKQKTYSGDTFEKVWLKFVMEVKFNKIWDGTNWTNSSTN